MDSRLGFRLLPVPGFRIPAVVENHEHGFDSVLVADGKEVIHTLYHPLRIVLENDAAEECPHGIEPEFLCPAKFLVDLVMVVSVGAPHLYRIDGGSRIVVASREPGQGGVPLLRLFRGPPF